MADISRLVLESIHTVTTLVERDDSQLNRKQCKHLAVCLQQVRDCLFSEPIHIYRRLLDRIQRTVKRVEDFVIKCNSKDWLVNALSIGICEEDTRDLVLELKWCIDTQFNRSLSILAPQLMLPSEEDIREDKKYLIDKLQLFLSKKNEKHKKHYLALYLQRRLEILEEAGRRKTLASGSGEFVEGDSTFKPSLEHIIWKLKLPEPSKHEPLGRGSSALVYKASWLGVPCAKKSLTGGGAKFAKEAGTLAVLNHPNIVTLYCCYEDKKSQSLMMELMDGSLFDLLDESQNGSPFDLEEALEILLQIAKGMLYLHRNGFAHRDLKSLNILVKKIKGARTHPSKGDFVVKLADFELVKLFDPTCSNLLTLTTKKVGTHVWRAPEVLMNNNGRVNPRRSDIYSFGMVCFEILSGEIPFKNCGLNSEELLNKIVHDGLRPTLSEDFPVELRTLIKSCWDADYARRPAFDEIYEQLLRLRSSLMMSGACIIITQPEQQVEKLTIKRAAVPFIQMCRKFVLHQAMSKEQSIELRKRETSESVKDESKGSEAAAPAHSNLMKKAESLPSSLVKPPRTWIDMAMGVSRFKLDHSSEDQIKAKLLLQAETSLESTETEIINTWELMEGLDDQMAPQTRPATISSKSPDMEVLSKLSNQPALKLIPRSLSLSSLEGHRILNAGDVVSEVVNTYSTSAGFLNYLEDTDLDEEKCPLGGNHRVVLYLTSLGCIPKTFEDCCSLRAILESFSVWVDERDVSMHAEFRQELRELVDGLVVVPRVFIKGRYIGGLDEVRRLHEDGKLGELLQDLPMVHFRKPCDGCSGVRFVLCPKCRGSCWIIRDVNHMVRCRDCNIDGLIRCAACF